MNTPKSYYSGCILLQNQNNFVFQSVNYPGVWLDKDNWVPNPVYFQKWSLNIMDKLHYVSSKESFTTFLTLTTKDDLDRLNQLLKTITQYYNRYFSIDSILRDNRHIHTKKEAEQFRKEQIEKFAKLEVELNLRKRVATRTKKGSKEYEEFLNDFRFRLNSSPNCDLQYIRILELQHNEDEKPHFHILSTHYVPESLIELVVENNKSLFSNSKISDVSYLLDNYIRKNKDLFPNYTLNKVKYYEDLLKSNSKKNSLINHALSYVTKYIIKEPTETYVKLKQKGYDNVSVARFSNGFYKKYPELRRQKTNNTKLGRLNKSLKIPYFTYKKKSLVVEEIDVLTNKVTLHKAAKSYHEKTAYIDFLNHLNGSGLFQFHKNSTFIKFKEDFAVKDLDYLNLIQKSDLTKLGITCNSNLYEELKSKYIVSKTLKYIYEKQSLQIVKSSINLNLTNFDKYQQKVLLNFESTPILNVIGKAGSGKTWTLSNLGHYDNDNTKFIVLTKKKRATQKLKEKYDQLGFTSVHLENIDSFLIKRGNIYVKNELNCIDDKNIVLILDEIGQITYDELYSIFAGINIDKIIRVVFGGDICQDKSFYGNSILDMLKDLDYIKELELLKNHRSNKKLTNIFNNFLDNKELTNFNLLNFYENKNEFKHLLEQKLNNNFTFIVNSKKLRDYVNEICLELPGKKKVIVDVNNRRYNLTNGDLYYIKSHKNQFYTLVNELTRKQIKIPNYIFDKHFIYAYALTVDKTQGDEFENVCVLFDNFSKNLLTHNKLFTALTRARENLKIYFENLEVYETCKSKKVTNDDLFLFKEEDKIIDVLDGLNSLDPKEIVKLVNDVYYKG